ncbi:biotin--[acetyl-CoA-carboxylase] ligase [Oceanobacillus senegalensis]|uniref:biotin--[acetyl-CoA-carboxylase] ligase n=1 Tax=Oceanobacillus senegalensis TaxID=1936063 RepID=UPI000A3092E7|nr:biotin--[acetyl-CoA-carboxylase] ligase [Oceanobacillus senegalensis]
MESTRNKLIEILSNNKDQYISGQDLSEKLQISRSAIWKHMNELKKDGYEIEGKSKKGYRIIQFPNKLSENTIKWGLKTNWLGKEVIHRESVNSTQIIAHDAARDGFPNGTIVVADEQTKGRGRITRSWHSRRDKGMWLSMVLRPEIEPNLAPQLTLLTATVLAEVLESYTNIKPQIKWPNDILVNKRKVAGILTEMQAEQDRIWYVIIGVGLNVNHNEKELSEVIKREATSLKLETNKEWALKEIIQEFLHTFEKSYEYYLENGFSNIKRKWEHYGFKIGQEISIKTFNEEWNAPFLGISEDGALVTKTIDGNTTKLYSAEIDWFR